MSIIWPIYKSYFVWPMGNALIFRLICCFFSVTWFVPDENYQSLEVAYRMVYGQGYLTWEWNSQWALRSTLHPLIYAFPFYVLRMIGVDFGWTIRWTPQIIHAILFAFADVCYFRWLGKLFLRHNTHNFIIALYLFNWFILYCSTRTLSNTLECCFTLIALNCYESTIIERKIKRKKNPEQCYHFSKCLFFVALATVIRPTTILLWTPLCLLHLFEYLTNNREKNSLYKILKTAKYLLRCLLFAFIVIMVAFIADSCYYGQFTFCLWNFIKFNIFGGGSAHFGAHPWYWYFIEGLPPILGLNIIPIQLFNLKERNIPKRYGIAAIFYIIGHSFIAHKEHRFVLPVIPLLLPYSFSIIDLFNVKIQKIYKCAIFISNFIAIIYIGLIHQRGPYATNSKVLSYLNSNVGNIQILHLIPCFSLPGYASLHPHVNRVQIRMLDCGIDPKNIGNKKEGNYTDEADEFHANPEDWLNRYWFTQSLFKYDFIICYKTVHRKIEPFLMQKGYQRYAEIFHTIFTSSDRQDSTIVILNKIES